MKRLVIGLLAVGALSSCGVGVDEPMLSSPSSSRQTLEAVPVSPQMAQFPMNPGQQAGEPDGGSAVALPQDPIPLLVLPSPVPIAGINPTFGRDLPPLPPR